MVEMRFIIFCIVIAAVRSDASKDGGYIPPEPFPTIPPTTIKPNSTSAPPTTTPKPTTAPTTTPTTTQPTTSTTKPTTPTTKPTTPSTKPTTSTTAKPTTPSTKPTPAPTPSPTPSPPVPEPSVGNWTVGYPNSNQSCIVFDLAAQFEIPVHNVTVKLNLPNNAIASGICNTTIQKIMLTWASAENISNTVEFGFSMNNSKFELETVNAVLNLTIPTTGAQVFELSHVKPEFSTPVKNSYKCAKVQTLEMKVTNSNNNQTAQLAISHVQFEAFANVTGHSFSAAKDCESSVTPDVVPIVVGCVLAALVVMVLIAYLIGRRRCQARGYLSM